jgi:hypothetical protein
LRSRLLLAAALLFAVAARMASASDGLECAPAPPEIGARGFEAWANELAGATGSEELARIQERLGAELRRSDPEGDAVLTRLAILNAACARLAADAELDEAERRRRLVAIEQAVRYDDDRAAAPRLAPDDAITRIVVFVRTAGEVRAAELVAEVLLEGETAAVSGNLAARSGLGELQTLSVVPSAPIPASLCRDLELDVRIGPDALFTFDLVAVELRTRSGARILHAFEPSGPFVLGRGRRSRSFDVRAGACPLASTSLSAGGPGAAR